MVAIELEPHIRSRGRCMLDPADHVQKHEPQHHRGPPCIIIHRIFLVNYASYGCTSLGKFYVLLTRSLTVQSLEAIFDVVVVVVVCLLL
ncbi:hypothetical protein TNCV_781581 [Trichonephila clavipes]|nr:hypothetical protein TNCV_781581 [Trichonephila clavipes]